MYPATAANRITLGHSPPKPVPAPTPAPELIDFIDFKWLMAAEGHRIDLTRLQTESAYARGCLALASGSTSATLRQAAGRLALSLGADAAWPQAGP